MSNFRKIERAVLAQLEHNSRMPFSKLGKKIRKSQQQISYTVQSLRSKEIIQNFFTIIDYSKLNTLNFRVYFRVSYTKEKTFEELIKYIEEDEHSSWIESCAGSYDLICTFFSPNPSSFNKTLRSIMEKFPRQLNNYSVLTTIVERDFGRKYLNPILNLSQKFVGGDRTPLIIDDLDIKILKNVSQDARISSVFLADQLSVTPKTIISRIKILQNKDVILGFKPLLDLRKVNYLKSLLLVKYHNITSEAENKLINYLKMHPNITSMTKTLGEWDIEIKIEVDNLIEMRKIEREIREKFSSLIKDIQSIPLYKTHKLNYFPEYLLT